MALAGKSLEQIRREEMTSIKNNSKNNMETFPISSCFWCPLCKGGGDLRVKNKDDYFKQKKNYLYYCLKCKTTLQINIVGAK